jgi:hypothetical protein
VHLKFFGTVEDKYFSVWFAPFSCLLYCPNQGTKMADEPAVWYQCKRFLTPGINSKRSKMTFGQLKEAFKTIQARFKNVTQD